MNEYLYEMTKDLSDIEFIDYTEKIIKKKNNRLFSLYTAASHPLSDLNGQSINFPLNIAEI